MTREDFNFLFHTHFEEVRKYVFYRSGDEELATDIAQDTFMRLWEKRDDIRLETVKGLLLKMATDLYITRYHKEKRAFNFFNTFVPREDALTPEDQLNYEELKKAYEEALKSMPEKQRVVFLMNRVDELKYREIAEQLGLSVKAIEKRMSLALEHLKQQLKDKVSHIVLLILTSCLFRRFKN